MYVCLSMNCNRIENENSQTSLQISKVNHTPTFYILKIVWDEICNCICSVQKRKPFRTIKKIKQSMHQSCGAFQSVQNSRVNKSKNKLKLHFIVTKLHFKSRSPWLIRLCTVLRYIWEKKNSSKIILKKTFISFCRTHLYRLKWQCLTMQLAIIIMDSYWIHSTTRIHEVHHVQHFPKKNMESE